MGLDNHHQLTDTGRLRLTILREDEANNTRQETIEEEDNHRPLRNHLTLIRREDTADSNHQDTIEEEDNHRPLRNRLTSMPIEVLVPVSQDTTRTTQGEVRDPQAGSRLNQTYSSGPSTASITNTI